METKVEKEAEKEIRIGDVVEIEYTEKAAYGKKGERATVHRILAEKLVKKGVAKIVTSK